MRKREFEKSVRSRDDELLLEGTILDALGGGRYSIETNIKTKIQAVLSGKLLQNKIRVLPGDYVYVTVSAYNTTLGRITFRGKKRENDS